MALVKPHGGGPLKPLLLTGEAASEERARAMSLRRLQVSSREKGDLVMLGVGGFTPLDGFMTHADWAGVCVDYRTASGVFWPIPITLSATHEFAGGLRVGEDIALTDPDSGGVLATMRVTEKYPIDKGHECSSVFRTTDPEHPGVRMVMAQGDVNLAGPVKVLSDGGFGARYGALFMTPAQTRGAFEALGWSTVAAFQTRNPMHRSHEYLAKVAIEVCDGVLIHSLLGNLKPGDIPADVRTRAIAVLTEKYFVAKRHECLSVFRTDDAKHPGVQMVMQQGEVNLAGPVTVLSDGGFKAKYGALFMTPAETRAEFERLGWSKVAAFQTRNPMHRSHEYLAKVAVEICDGVLVHSLLGNLKPGDIPAEVRTRAIAILIERYFRPGTVVQAGYPLDMRYAGPREALLHAVFRQNYGCAWQIVGRDHAGVGSYYGPFDAHRIFDEIPRDALVIQPMKLDLTFWCYACGGMASGRTCPHGDADRLQVSGTGLRRSLSEGLPVPPEFSRPEVLEVLRAYYAALDAPETVEAKRSGQSAR